MRTVIQTTSLLAALAVAGYAQSAPAEATVTLGGKALTVKYSAPSVRGRKIFGPGGLLSMDPTYPIWRAGANSATMFRTDADLDLGGLRVPKGIYSLYVNVANPDAWELVVNKQTGQWGLSYEAKQDLGRVKMTMAKPTALVERLKIALSGSGAAGKLQIEWENRIASVAIAAR